MRIESRISLAVLAALFSGALASAQVPRTAPTPGILQNAHAMPSAPEAAKDWQRRLRKTDDRLRAGEWSKARREAGRLLSEMLFSMEIDGQTASTLGLALTFRALAEAGDGDVEAGQWDWLAAQALQPDLNEVSLDPYGVGGKPLELFRKDDLGGLSAAAVRAIGLPPPAPAGEEIPPKKLSGGTPRFPKALRATCAKGTARIAVTVDAAGRPTHPRWLDASGGPAMALALFEAVRGWRWQPGLRGGQAVPAEIEIAHEFDPGRCRPRDE